MQWLLVALSLLLFQASPIITVSPDSGQPGATLIVNGSAFTAGARVKVLWDGANLGGTLQVGADGTFTYSGSVPADAAVGTHSVTARGVGGARDSATATFTVAAPVTTTTATTTTTTVATTTTTVATTTTTATTTTSAVASRSAPTTTNAGSPDTTADAPVDAASGTEATTDAESLTVASGDAGGVGDAPTATTVQPNSAPPSGSGTRSGNSTGVPGMLWVSGLLAVLILGGGLVFVVWRRSRREGETEPAATPTVEEIGTLVPLVAADVRAADGDWTRDMMTLTPSGAIDGIIGTSNRLIAFGQAAGANGDGRQAAIWESSDGIGWQSVAMLGPGSARLAVPWRNGLLVATLRKHDERIDTTCWWSDDGSTWSEQGHDEVLLRGATIEGGTANDDAAVLWGRSHHGSRVWVSEDGAAWQESALRGGVDLVAHLGDAFVAFGRGSNSRPTVAYSTDGLSWDESRGDNPVVFEGARMVVAVPFEGRFVAGGTDIMRGVAATWATDDGRRWHRTSLPSTASTHLADLVVAGDRLLAVGVVRDAGRRAVEVWESNDAASWKPVATPELFADATAKAMQMVGDSAVVCGTLYVERDDARVESVPVTWRSRILDSSEPSAQEVADPQAVREPEPVPAR